VASEGVGAADALGFFFLGFFTAAPAAPCGGLSASRPAGVRFGLAASFFFAGVSTPTA